MIRIVLIADSERELDAEPVGLVQRANIITVRDARGLWRVIKSPRGRELLGCSYASPTGALEAALDEAVA